MSGKFIEGFDFLNLRARTADWVDGLRYVCSKGLDCLALRARTVDWIDPLRYSLRLQASGLPGALRPLYFTYTFFFL